MRVRHVAELNPRVPQLTRDNAGLDISFLPLEKIWADHRFDPSTTVTFSGDIQSYNAVAEGDILIPKVSPTFSHGRVALADQLVNRCALATSEVFVLRARSRADARFLRYRLMAADVRQEGEASWVGVAGLKRVSGDFIKDVFIAPEGWAQRSKITAFLDVSLAKVDELANELVEARRLAKEWLVARTAELLDVESGDVAFGRYATLQRGFDLPSDQRVDGSVQVIGSGGPSGTHNVAAVNGPAVVTGRYGSIGVVTWSDSACWPLNTSLYVSDFKGNDPRFVYWSLRSLPLRREAAKAAVPGLHRADVHRLRIGRFEKDEQRRIAAALDKKQAEVGELEEERLVQLNLIAAYRDALLTEAVTGRLDLSRLSEGDVQQDVAALTGRSKAVVA